MHHAVLGSQSGETRFELATIHGDIWRGETIAGPPIESFTLAGAVRSYTTTELKSGGRYYIAVLTRWSRFLDRGDSSRAFLVDQEQQPRAQWRANAFTQEICEHDD